MTNLSDTHRQKGGLLGSRSLQYPTLLSTAALLVLAYPPVGAGWLAYFALVPFLFSLAQVDSWRHALGQGALLGWLFSCGLFYFTWIISTATWLERLGASLAITAIFVLQFCLLSLGMWSLLRWCASTANRKNGRNMYQYLRRLCGVILVGALWMAVEWAVQQVCFGLSGYLGLTQWRYPAVVHLARWVGLMGVSAAVAMVNAGIYFTLCSYFSHRILRRSTHAATAMQLTSSLAAVVLILFLARAAALRSTGVWPTGESTAGRTTLVSTSPEAEHSIPVFVQRKQSQTARSLQLVLVQNGFTMTEYEAANNDSDVFRSLYSRLIAQSLTGAENGWQAYKETTSSSGKLAEQPDSGAESPVLLLWPETVLHEPVLNYPQYADDTLLLPQRAKAWLVAGLPWSEGLLYYNSAIVINPAGQLAGMYSKTRPIPVAEQWATPGSGWQPVTLNNIKVGIALCSELIDPLPAKVLAERGAEILVFLSSLDHLGRSSALGLQGAFAPFRAAETGRYVAQVGSVGLTLVANPSGSITAVLPSRVAGTLIAQVPAITEQTPYLAYGNQLPLVALAISILVQVGLVVVKRRK